MRTYLVTGGAGFIGSNYIHYMFEKYGDEIRIINVDALTYAGNLENLKGVEERKNYTSVHMAFCRKMNYSVNFIFCKYFTDRLFIANIRLYKSIIFSFFYSL